MSHVFIQFPMKIYTKLWVLWLNSNNTNFGGKSTQPWQSKQETHKKFRVDLKI